jgi:transposase
MRKKNVVTLSDEERERLLSLLRKGRVPARQVARAQVLLQAADGLGDETIAAGLHIGRATVERTRRKFVLEGIEGALKEKPRPGGQRRLDGKQEAFLVALACSTPPDGRTSWTMQLLADRLVALKVVETVSDETVRRTLKKTRRSRG